jgi:hypothetical protein
MLGATLFQLQNAMQKNSPGAKLKSSQDEYLQQIQSNPKMQEQGQEVNPAWRTEDAIKGILGAGLATAFGGNDGLTNFLSSYVGTKQSDADSKNANAEKKRQESNQQLRDAYELGNKVSETKLRFAQDAFNRDQANIQRQEALADKREDEQTRRDQISLNQAERDYLGAKSEVGMLHAAQRRAGLQQRLGVDVTPVDPVVVQQDWAERASTQRNAIRDDHFRVVKDSLNEFGTIRGGLLGQMTKSRDISAKEMVLYGMKEQDAKDLLFIPTEDSLKKLKQDQWLENAKQKGIDDHDKAVQAIAKSKADVERAKERIAIARDNLRIQGFRADTGRMSHELRESINRANGQITAKIKDITKKIGSIEGKSEGLRAKQKKLSEQGNILGAQAVEAEIEKLRAERDYWNRQIEGPPEDVDKITATSGFSTTMSDGTKVSWKP